MRIAVDVESVDSASNGVYHARMREGGSGESYGSLVISLVGYPYDTRIWRASFDCVNRRVRSGSATYYYRSAMLPEGKPDDPPRGPWISATATDPDGILLEAFCRLEWKKALVRG